MLSQYAVSSVRIFCGCLHKGCFVLVLSSFILANSSDPAAAQQERSLWAEFAVRCLQPFLLKRQPILDGLVQASEQDVPVDGKDEPMKIKTLFDPSGDRMVFVATASGPTQNCALAIGPETQKIDAMQFVGDATWWYTTSVKDGYADVGGADPRFSSAPAFRLSNQKVEVAFMLRSENWLAIAQIPEKN